MTTILSKEDVKQMRKEVDRSIQPPKITPPKGREYWDVKRIVKTLEWLYEYYKDREVILTNCPFCGNIPAYTRHETVVCQGNDCPLEGMAIDLPDWNRRKK